MSHRAPEGVEEPAGCGLEHRDKPKIQKTTNSLSLKKDKTKTKTKKHELQLTIIFIMNQNVGYFVNS